MSDMKEKKYHIPFQKSLFLTISGLFVIFVAITVALQYYQEKNIRKDNLNTLLQEYNSHVALRLPEYLSGDTSADDTTFVLYQKLPFRLTIINATTGEVLLDNESQGNIESSHADRPEIQDAIEGINDAYAIRYSETMGQTYFYAARRYGDYVIRSSMPFDATVYHILNVDTRFRYILLCIAFLFVIALFLFCRSLGRSITALDYFAQQAEQELPLDTPPVSSDNTIGRITLNLRNIYEHLRQTRENLALEEEKLLTHIQMSREGIAIFTRERKMIVSNNLFIQYLNYITDSTIDDNLTQIFSEEELSEIIRFVTQPYSSQRNDGKALIKQKQVYKNARLFDIRGILFHDNSFEISIFDNTERMRDDLLKKQLTQNVAHELKTPVSGIRGYLETILSTPHLDEGKRNLFMERCYAQTRRLSDLLHDISMLNRMDESSDLFDRQNIDLATLVNDCIAESATQLEAKAMQIQTRGFASPMNIDGNHSLLYSIFRNLIDNAISYAGENTRIMIDCYLTDEKYYYISFADNGVGVEEAHLQRLFERFYRVDKGRSRKLGGTGLGLAIVKNAVIFHGGEIMAKNAQGGGLDILFTLRKKDSKF